MKPVYVQTFIVEHVTPDPRQYNQQRQIFKPITAQIIVKLDVNDENFHLPGELYEKFKLAELGQGEWPEVPEFLSYTPLGWSRVMEQLEAPYKEKEMETQEWDDSEFSDSYEEM